MKSFLTIALFALLKKVSLIESKSYIADVIIYESTPAGVMASVAASNNTDLKVILISTTAHIGGMCSSGLGHTDYGNDAVIGGLTKQFFIRNGKYYNEPIQFSLEPHIALNIFMEMMNESNVNIIIDSPILKSNIDNTNDIIQSITTINGNEYIAKLFIDASYEGDLFGISGVSYALGRESNDQYNETINGRTKPEVSTNRYFNNFKFYVHPYDENGNVLPLITPFDNEKIGQKDNRMEAMNYRLCITKNTSNRIPFTKPSSYDPNRWELLRRMYRIKPPIVDLMPSCNTAAVPNAKYDMNNCGAISTDFVGYSDNYINSSYEQRKVIAELTKNYTLELLWFLCSDDTVPKDVQNVMNNEWGLCKDEFMDNEYFPPQLYVREGRRMINKDFVFTQNTAVDNAVYGFNDKNLSIGMGSFNFDVHNVQRYACRNSSICYSEPPTNNNTGCDYNNMGNCSYAWNEGEIQIKPDPYEIPYMVLTPTKGEINNILVPVGVSASHIGFSTLRMEPQWMIMGHSAGTASSILIKNGNENNVQGIDLIELKQTLLKQGQVLSL